MHLPLVMVIVGLKCFTRTHNLSYNTIENAGDFLHSSSSVDDGRDCDDLITQIMRMFAFQTSIRLLHTKIGLGTPIRKDLLFGYTVASYSSQFTVLQRCYYMYWYSMLARKHRLRLLSLDERDARDGSRGTFCLSHYNKYICRKMSSSLRAMKDLYILQATVKAKNFTFLIVFWHLFPDNSAKKIKVEFNTNERNPKTSYQASSIRNPTSEWQVAIARLDFKLKWYMAGCMLNGFIICICKWYL